MSELLDQVVGRQPRAIARAVTLAENGDEVFLQALDAKFIAIPQAVRLGITGPPGAGKSTLTSALVAEIRDTDKSRVGVVAIDPSSPFSGGALLADRVRMSEHVLDTDVFVRSMASRGQFGGLAIGAEDACEIMALAGFDPVIVETVGVGQSEVDIARLADTTIVVLTPSAGDSMQALKAGIMEVADIVVINKADHKGAHKLQDDVQEALELRPHPPADKPFWIPPIVQTIATEKRGIRELLKEVGRHRKFLKTNNLFELQATERVENRVRELTRQALQKMTAQGGKLEPALQAAIQQVTNQTQSPRQAVKALLAELQKT
ncbi:MAG: methylmalonyl Co-A mutase-associated GTPase MeaB [Planctomycetes bacterium]|nr:methylmalonyl Co-A mutase-associated GTPase MeaB [Planctomycetota bacterium]